MLKFHNHSISIQWLLFYSNWGFTVKLLVLSAMPILRFQDVPKEFHVILSFIQMLKIHKEKTPVQKKHYNFTNGLTIR